jgi:sugar phosphate isomerase/epimerase
MKISISTGAFYTYSYIEVLDMINETGCKNIEIFLNQSFKNENFKNIEKEVLKRNMTVLSIHAPLSILVNTNETEFDCIKKSVELAKLFNTKIVVAHDVVGGIRDNNYFSLDKIHKENLLFFRNYSEVEVVTENVSQLQLPSFIQNSSEIIDFLEPNDLKMTYDVSHWGSLGRSAVEGYNLFKKYIRNIHISDNIDGIEHVVLGKGKMDLNNFIKLLIEDDYKYPLTIELDLENKKRNPINNKNEAIDALCKSYYYIKNFLIEV